MQNCSYIQKCYSNRAYMRNYCLCVNDFFILFFSLPLRLVLPLCLLLTTKSQNHPCPSLNHRSLFSSNNKITKPLLPSLNHRSRWYHPNTKSQKLKLAITHHNTKTQKLKLAIIHHRTSKNQMKSNPKINQNLDEVKWGPWQHYIKIGGGGGGGGLLQLGLAWVVGDSVMMTVVRLVRVWEICRRKRRKNKEKKEEGKGEQERGRWFRGLAWEKEKNRWVEQCG